MSPMDLPRGLLLLAAVICVGCAAGSTTPSDARAREVRARDSRLEGIDLASPDTATGQADRGRDAVPDQRLRDLPRDQAAKDLPRDQLAEDLPRDQKVDGTCVCGAGMRCADGACVCDPATCAGCCTGDGKSCKTGQDNAECGAGGAVCKVCSTADSCKTASCATGTCVLSRKNGAAYPCPGAFGTVCGGTTGIVCFTGLTCVTFTTGTKGFCSKTCTGSGSICTGAPVGTAECLLTGSSGQLYCGFVCFPGTCPTGLTCDYSAELCKP